MILVMVALAAASCNEEEEGAAAEGDECAVGDHAFAIVDQEIDGRVLRLQVEYTGGCEEHAFEVWWGGAVATSDPPVVPLEIQHHGNGDTCQRLVREEIAIDLRALDEVGTEAIRLQLVVGEGGAQTLLEILYVVPEGPTEVPPEEAFSINRDCTTITG